MYVGISQLLPLPKMASLWIDFDHLHEITLCLASQPGIQ